MMAEPRARRRSSEALLIVTLRCPPACGPDSTGSTGGSSMDLDSGAETAGPTGSEGSGDTELGSHISLDDEGADSGEQSDGQRGGLAVTVYTYAALEAVRTIDALDGKATLSVDADYIFPSNVIVDGVVFERADSTVSRSGVTEWMIAPASAMR